MWLPPNVPHSPRRPAGGVGLACVDLAKALGCKQLNCLAGIAPKGVDEKKLRETFVSNLRYAAPLFKAEGIKLLIEAINTIDIPGFYLNTTQQSADIVKEVGMIQGDDQGIRTPPSSSASINVIVASTIKIEPGISSRCGR